jgi:hypothetical protein
VQFLNQPLLKVQVFIVFVSDLCKGAIPAKAHTNGFAAFGVGAEFAHAVGFFSGNISSIFDLKKSPLKK